jgi:hypothetical protein
MKRLAALLLVLLATLSAAPARALSAAPHGTGPTSFARGKEPRVAWLGGRVIHTAGGRTFTLPLAADRAPYLRYLGRSRHSWVVADLGPVQGRQSRVLTIHRGRAHVVVTVPSYYDRPSYLLGRHSNLVSSVDYDRGGAVATVYDLNGRVVGQRSYALGATVLDIHGDDVILGVGKTYHWHPGTPPVPFAKGAAMVDLARDVLFADHARTTGPTSLSSPGTPAWTTKDFSPRAISPDGRWVAGYSADSISRDFRRLEIRSMADGSLQPTTGLLLERNAALGWERGDRLLVGVHSDRGNALARCSVGGRCHRATDWLPGQAVTLPHQVEYFFDWP